MVSHYPLQSIFSQSPEKSSDWASFMGSTSPSSPASAGFGCLFAALAVKINGRCPCKRVKRGGFLFFPGHFGGGGHRVGLRVVTCHMLRRKLQRYVLFSGEGGPVRLSVQIPKRLPPLQWLILCEISWWIPPVSGCGNAPCFVQSPHGGQHIALVFFSIPQSCSKLKFCFVVLCHNAIINTNNTKKGVPL